MSLCLWTALKPSCRNLLFRRLAIKMFLVGLCVGSSMVDDAIAMVGRRIKRIEFQWACSGIDDVVICSRRNEYRESRSDRCARSVKNRLTCALFYAKELVELVNFRSDLALGFNAMTTS